MRRLSFVMTAAAMVVGMAAGRAILQAQAEKAAKTRVQVLQEQIEAKERQELEALKSGNTQEFANLIAEEAVFVDPRGQQSGGGWAHRRLQVARVLHGGHQVRGALRDFRCNCLQAHGKSDITRERVHLRGLCLGGLGAERRPLDVRVQPGDAGKIGTSQARVQLN
jgi:hypothetical protein